MAFDASALSPIYMGGKGGQKVWSYITTDDPLTVASEGYFVLEDVPVQAGDFFIIAHVDDVNAPSTATSISISCVTSVENKVAAINNQSGGDLLASNNLSDLVDATLAKANLGIPLNKYDATQPPEATNDSSEGYSAGSEYAVPSLSEVYLCLDPTENNAVWLKTSSVSTVIKNTYDATSAPTVNHDSTQGYSVGSKLLDTSNDHLWICFDATEGAADWRMISGAIASLGGGNVLTFNPDSDFEWIDLNGKHRTNVNIFRDWPGVQLHPTANGGFGYIDFVKHDRPNQDFQFRLRSDPTSEQMVFEHFDANDVYSYIHSLTGDGNIWSKSYGWLHDKFAAKDEVSAWEHIQTISTDTPVLDFTFQNLSQYRALKLTFDVRPDTDHAQLWLRTSRDNGSNFDAGPSDYGYVQHFAWHAGHGYGGGHSSTAFVLAANLGNASSAYRVAGELQLTELNKPKRTYMKGEYFNLNRSTDLVSYGFGGLTAPAEANDAIRIFFNAGQIAEGFVTLEGIKG